MGTLSLFKNLGGHIGKWIYEVIPIPSESILRAGGEFKSFSTIDLTFQDLSVESFYKVKGRFQTEPLFNF